MTKQIPLTQGKFATVDDVDYELLAQYRWFYHPAGKTGYATRHFGKGRKDRRMVRMHREIMCPPSGKVIDHIDGDGLNNVRSNLRVCSQTENMRNMSKRKDNPSGYKCVRQLGKKWEAYIRVDGKRKTLGRFGTAELAAQAFNDAALKYYGKTTRLNALNTRGRRAEI